MPDTIKRLPLIPLLLAAVLIGAAVNTEAPATPSPLRFHVIAAGDGAFDQTVKLKVRDAVLTMLAPELRSCDSPREAEKVAIRKKEEIETAAAKVLEAYHVDYGAAVEIGESVFPTKSYGDITLGAGRYRAVRVILGEGEGKNWWCVLYPPLCFVELNDDVAVAVRSEGQPKEKGDILCVNASPTETKIRFKLAELLP